MARSRQHKKFYIYCFVDGCAVLYVGKGSGKRLEEQERRFGMKGRVIERLSDEYSAYAREKHWIKVLKPTENKNGGGGGSFVSHRGIPPRYRGKISIADWRKVLQDCAKDEAEIERVGMKAHIARFLLRKIDERNCADFGLSKVDVERWRSYANG